MVNLCLELYVISEGFMFFFFIWEMVDLEKRVGVRLLWRICSESINMVGYISFLSSIF